MNDSELREVLARQQKHNREQRIVAIKRWVRYIQDQPADVWGPQLNDLVDSQLRSARETGLDPDHYWRIERAERDR